MTVTGIPIDAIDFYEDLGADNSRTWWQANKDRYAASVRTPLTSLLEELADEFGTPHLFRPHRDVRFSPDKRPYKDHQGALCLTAPGMGYYVQLSADGLRIGGGYYPTGKDQLVRQRAAIDAPETGLALAAIADALVAQGFELGADPVATRPRGVPADHPRLELLRYRTLIAVRALGEPSWLSTPDVTDHVAGLWRQVRPLVDWLTQHVGESRAQTPG
ncbi:MAG: DUF2461 domain-containing protein [Phycicoccus sp.]|nr:DUF2461 domain-containing protein [Phycicoccus sp.]